MDYGKEYKKLHKSSPSIFAGTSALPRAHSITKMVWRYKPRTLLDFGCGKGLQYSEHRIHERWGGLMPHLYDIGVTKFAKRPTTKFDGIICTDVLEHITREDLPALLDQLFGYLDPTAAEPFVFFSIACRLSKKSFRGGANANRNLHVTVEMPDWWSALLDRHKPPRVSMQVEFVF